MKTESKAKTPDRQAMEAAGARMDRLLKPIGSLGLLEETAIRLAGIYGTDHPRIGKKKILVFAADHGIVAEGVASAPQAFTKIQTEVIAQGRTGVGILARQNGADLETIDIGLIGELKEKGIVQAKVRAGTRNFLYEDAMTEAEAAEALSVGAARVRQAVEDGYTLIGLGEMGIGNTTPTAAIVHTMHPEIPLETLVGKGAGLTDADWQHKIAVIRKAVQNRQPDPESPFSVLQKVGGLEIAGMAGGYLEAAAQGVPVVIDGVISMAAAYLAWKIDPKIRPYLFASHRSAEPAYTVMCEEMQLHPALELQMRLGEGSGCPLMFYLMEAACTVLQDMASFEEIGVSGDFLIDVREEKD